jgi:hypothetical protein
MQQAKQSYNNQTDRDEAQNKKKLTLAGKPGRELKYMNETKFVIQLLNLFTS